MKMWRTLARSIKAKRCTTNRLPVPLCSWNGACSLFQLWYPNVKNYFFRILWNDPKEYNYSCSTC